MKTKKRGERKKERIISIEVLALWKEKGTRKRDFGSVMKVWRLPLKPRARRRLKDKGRDKNVVQGDLRWNFTYPRRPFAPERGLM